MASLPRHASLLLAFALCATACNGGTIQDNFSGGGGGNGSGGASADASTVVADPNTSVSIPAPLPDSGAPLPNQNSVNMGPNVLIFDASMDAHTVQSQCDAVFQKQQTNQFGSDRYALLFKPGSYAANVQVGFYTTVHGLGTVPDAVTITGGVNSTAAWASGNATTNFWRGMENLAIVPSTFNGDDVWAVSQATHVRRVHVKGDFSLYDPASYPGGVDWSSGGFVADSVVDKNVVSGSQQQFFTRNTTLNTWMGQQWNMVFVGTTNAPTGQWPNDKYTAVQNTPTVREKPFLTVDNANNFSVVVPALKRNSQGASWNTTSNLTPTTTLPLEKFYVAQASVDDANSLNIALQRGYNLLLTPGVYNLAAPLVVRNPNTVVLGMGLATLAPTQNTPVLMTADVDGITIAGLLLDAGPQGAPNLLQLGEGGVAANHSANPTAIFDVHCRVGGAAANAHATSCMVVNSHDALIDNTWLWRADHGADDSYVGWTVNSATNGLVVNSDNVTAYGLFVEHFQGYQTLWNGNGGSTYFYQSEIPYDVPSQDAWSHDGVNGYASYKVADSVTTHAAQGMGVYCNFYNDVELDNAIETGTSASMHHLLTEWLGAAQGSAINHVLNNTGAAVSSHNGDTQATSQN